MLVSVSTVAIYKIFFTRQFSYNGHLLSTLQLHVTSMIFSVVFCDFPIVVFHYLSYVFCATLS